MKTKVLLIIIFLTVVGCLISNCHNNAMGSDLSYSRFEYMIEWTGRTTETITPAFNVQQQNFIVQTFTENESGYIAGGQCDFSIRPESNDLVFYLTQGERTAKRTKVIILNLEER